MDWPHYYVGVLRINSLHYPRIFKLILVLLIVKLNSLSWFLLFLFVAFLVWINNVDIPDVQNVSIPAIAGSLLPLSLVKVLVVVRFVSVIFIVIFVIILPFFFTLYKYLWEDGILSPNKVIIKSLFLQVGSFDCLGCTHASPKIRARCFSLRIKKNFSWNRLCLFTDHILFLSFIDSWLMSGARLNWQVIFSNLEFTSALQLILNSLTVRIICGIHLNYELSFLSLLFLQLLMLEGP